MSPVHLRNLGIPRNHPEDRPGLFRVGRPGSGSHGHHDRWEDTEGNNIQTAIHLPIECFKMGRTRSILPECMSQRDTLKISYGNHQRMESQQEVQTPGGKGSKDKGESSHYRIYRIKTEPGRAYSDYFRLERSRPTQFSSGFTSFRH
ncbi:hypothetical protein O181_117782 [Austropuccinia psidii MF-1]|uniref:Uncharacterized protein n=1 Tax=Austropuccinia psidii MF-1 TaxID=1389203 RepID=A0A9Q3KBW7_9BASI|nr:hypothetical protein [Austropuccinia psidii MF-1]